MTSDLLDAIYAILSAKASTYYQRASDSASLPYIVYSLVNSDESLIDDNDRLDYSMEVNIYSQDVGALETLTDEVDALLDGIDGINGTATFHVFRLNRILLPMEENVHGRQIRYRVDAILR